MSGPTRQHYTLATGSGIAKGASGPSTTPRFAKGGLARVQMKSPNTKRPPMADKAANTGQVRKGLVAKGFTNGIPTSAAKNVGTVPTTTNAKGRDPKGYDLAGPGGKNRNV